MTLFDLIPTQIASDIKDLCNYTCEGEYLHHQEWLEVNDDDSDGHIYQTAERIREWINKEVPFQVLLNIGRGFGEFNCKV